MNPPDRDPAAIDAVRQVHSAAAGRDDRVEAGAEGGGVVGAVIAHRAVVGDVEGGGTQRHGRRQKPCEKDGQKKRGPWKGTRTGRADGWTAGMGLGIHRLGVD